MFLSFYRKRCRGVNGDVSYKETSRERMGMFLMKRRRESEWGCFL